MSRDLKAMHSGNQDRTNVQIGMQKLVVKLVKHAIPVDASHG